MSNKNKNNTRKNKKYNNNTNPGNNEAKQMKELYPNLELSFSEAQEWLIKHLDSSAFKKRENASNTISSIPIIQKIVKEGMITQNSQEGTISKGVNKFNNTFYKEKQRAYLSGFLLHKDSFKFVDWINTYTDKVAFVTAIIPDDIDHFIRRTTTPIAVTVGTSSKTKLPENPTNYTIDSIIPQSFDEETFHSIKRSSNIKDDVHVDFVNIFDPKYGRLASSKDGLYADVLKGLKH